MGSTLHLCTCCVHKPTSTNTFSSKRATLIQKNVECAHSAAKYSFCTSLYTKVGAAEVYKV